MRWLASVAAAPTAEGDGVAGNEVGPGQHDGRAGFARAQPATVPIEGAATGRVEGLERAEAGDHERGQMVHARHEHGVGVAALNQFRGLLQRDQPGRAGDGNALHGTARAMGGGEVGGEEVALQMAAGGIGTGASIRDAFERFEIGLGGGEDEAEAGGGDGRERIVGFSAGLRQGFGRELERGIVTFLITEWRRADDGGLKARLVEAVGNGGEPLELARRAKRNASTPQPAAVTAPQPAMATGGEAALGEVGSGIQRQFSRGDQPSVAGDDAGDQEHRAEAFEFVDFNAENLTERRRRLDAKTGDGPSIPPPRRSWAPGIASGCRAQRRRSGRRIRPARIPARRRRRRENRRA